MTANMRQQTDIRITTVWKRHRPGLERGLTVIAACFVLLSVAPAVSIAMVVPNSAIGVGGVNERNQEVRNVSEHGSNGNTCLTAACNDTATMILNNMDRSVEPCDNFYRYVCGGYLNSTKIPDGEESVDVYTRTISKLYEQLRAIVEAEIAQIEPRAYGLVKKYYKSCMNEAAIEARGVQPLIASLQRIGGWPVVEGASWNETNFDWTKAYELHKSGHPFRHIIEVQVVLNRPNSTEYVIYITSPKGSIFHYSGSKNFSDKTLPAYFNYILDVAIRLGAQNNTDTEEEVKEVFELELNLMMLTKSELTRNNTAAVHLTLTELERRYPSIPWQEFISKRLSSSIPVEKNQVVVIEPPIYFNRIDKLMTNTSKRVLANWIGWTTAFNTIKYLNKEMLEKRQQLMADLEKDTMAQPRWKICIERVSSLSFAIESMYVSRHLSADAKRNVASMMDGVRKAIRKTLETVRALPRITNANVLLYGSLFPLLDEEMQQTDWLDKITKRQALKKLDALYTFIAYGDQLPDADLDKIYENLEIDEENYYENSIKVSLFNKEYTFVKLRQPVDKRDSVGGIRITDVRAASFPYRNTFVLTVGILQDNFFGKDRPWYMNYGAIGAVIGHEITHGFDGRGRWLDERGESADWWQPSSDQEFSKRAQCIVDQYSNYMIEEVGLHVNGESTRDENIADNGGIKGAYLAYNNWVAKNGEEPKLPGIDMTPNQLFWISTAALMCAKYTPNGLVSYIHRNEHSPNEARIIGPLSNIPEFGKDFGCPVGSNMNPTKKCPVW